MLCGFRSFHPNYNLEAINQDFGISKVCVVLKKYDIIVQFTVKLSAAMP